jgi:general secretion pathway protein G
MFSTTYPHPRRAARAFTLLEILIALAILSLLVGLAVADLGGIFDGAKVKTVQLFVNDGIKTPLFTYKMAMGSYPSTNDGLNALITAPSSGADNWRGPYLIDGKLPLDPWSQPYQYCFPGVHNKNGYDVWSKGPPEKPKDIGNWSDTPTP